jgi:hypothetical protein
MRRGYFVPMSLMVIYGYEIPGGALNLNSTNYPDHGHHGDPLLSGKNPHGRAGNRTRDLMISSRNRWPLDREDGRPQNVIVYILTLVLSVSVSKRFYSSLHVQICTLQTKHAWYVCIYTHTHARSHTHRVWSVGMPTWTFETGLSYLFLIDCILECGEINIFVFYYSKTVRRIINRIYNLL